MILRFTDDSDVEAVLAVMKRLPLHTRQDMSFITAAHDLLLFKTIDAESGGTVAAVRSTVEAYIGHLRLALTDATCAQSEVSSQFRVYVGSFHRDFCLYRSSFAHAHWLMSQPFATAESESDIIYFNDHVYRYIRSTIPAAVFENIFAVPVECAREPAFSSLAETVDALLRTNMSIKEAAASPRIHRNTMRARLERIGRQFGIDPLNNARDREFLLCLGEYLRLSRQQ